MKDLQSMYEEVKVDLRRNEIPFKEGVSISLNNRFIRKLGVTTRSQGKYKIQIQGTYFEYGKDIDVRSTIAHELIHTTEKGFNHGTWFKYYASILNKTGKYKVVVRAKGSEMCEEVNNKLDYRGSLYTVTCSSCDGRWNYGRMCNTLKYIKMYNCPYCKTQTLSYVKIDS